MREGHCQIGCETDIKEGEIHALQEGLTLLPTRNTTNTQIVLYVDNQIALQALAGGPTVGREYIKGCLEEEKILQRNSCRIRGKWTPSHMRIIGNQGVDTLAKDGSKDNLCPWSRTTLP